MKTSFFNKKLFIRENWSNFVIINLKMSILYYSVGENLCFVKYFSRKFFGIEFMDGPLNSVYGNREVALRSIVELRVAYSFYIPLEEHMQNFWYFFNMYNISIKLKLKFEKKLFMILNKIYDFCPSFMLSKREWSKWTKF